jgi:hypothetical protein
MKSGELLLGLSVGLALAGGSAWADDAAVARVGRVSAVAGPVQYQASGGAWAEALVNEPVPAGTGVRSASDADAELRLPGIHVALAAASELKILRLDRDAAQIAVSRGRVGVHLDGGAPTVEIDLPRGGVWLSGPGDYDIAAGDDQAAPRVQVFAGKALLGGGLDEANLAAASPDTFSDWWRSQNDDAGADTHHLAPGIAGAAALDAGGSWEANATYGEVWYPNGLADGWTPYRDGAWRYLPPSGWTWVDDAAWGFAPSHYGRWTRIDDRWAWVPPKDGEVDYSPAAVAFLGTAAIGLSCPGDTGPAVAWLPLAPGEAVGDGNEETYKNRRFASAVPRAVFAGGRPVAPALVDLPEQRFADAPVILGPLGIAPTATPAIASAAKKPVVIALMAAAPRLLAAVPAARKLVFARLHEALLHPVLRKRLTMAAAAPAPTVVRPRPQPSTSAIRPAHTRQHLAADRRGTL